MMAETADQLAQRLHSLKERRRSGDVNLRAYYAELLSILNDMVASLVEEVGNMEESDIALQVPLVVLFLEEQVRKFGDRE